MLQLKLNSTLSADGTQLLIEDATGAYNVSTNPGGYGTPNRAISSDIILRWKLHNSSTWTVLSGWTGAPYIITTVTLGLTPTNEELLPDGVEHIQYLGLYSKGTTGTVSSGSNRIGFTGLDFTGINYIALGSDLSIIYKIVSRGSSYLILDKCYEGLLSSETIYDAQNGDTYQLVQTYTNAELDSKVAGTSEEELCGDQLEKIFTRMMRLFIAQARFEKTDYYGADLIMQNLFAECFIRRGTNQCT